MKKFDMGYFVAVILAFAFMGMIYGLVIFGAVGILLDAPLWVVGMSIFFLVFHIHDMQKMNGAQRLIRFLWVFTLCAAIAGIVWLFVPREDWLAPRLLDKFAFVPLIGAVVGLLLGLIEGIRPNAIRPKLKAISERWKEVGNLSSE